MKNNLKFLSEWEVMLTPPCLIPMLYAVKSLIKFAQSPMYYIVDFILIVKICESDLYRMYLDPTDTKGEGFLQFQSLVVDTSTFMEQD